MVELPEGLVESEDDGGEDGDATDDAKEDAFCHNETEIETHGEGHKAESDKAGDGGGGATKDGT